MAITYYLMTRTGSTPPDFATAEALVAGDDDAEYYVEKISEPLKGIFDEDDGTEEVVAIDGTTSVMFQDHHGQGDGGCADIANTEWIAADYPGVFTALGVKFTWMTAAQAVVGISEGSVG